MSMTNLRLQQALIAGMGLTSAYSANAQNPQASSSGEVRGIDSAAGKITIKHGAIADLGLPAMTLVYRIDPSLLAGIKPGDKVAFTATRENDKYVVIAIKK
jgi:Cu(I)/Ag(I) efflux system protein CusF